MKILLKAVRVIYSIYAILMFVGLMLVMIPFVIVFSFFGRIRGGNLIYRACSVWGDCWFFLLGIRHRNIYLSQKPPPGNCIYVINHVSYMDVPALVVSVREPVRVLGKIELSRIPVFGFLYRYATVMVDRSSVENRAKSVKTLKSILKRGISVVIFPEGTFNETGQPLAEFFNGAFRIALETQTPIRPVVFLDTLDRLHYKSIFSLRPGLLRSVFLDEIPVAGLTMKDLDQLKEMVYNNMKTEIVKWKNL
ncbi:MAG: lysophospholipid acyltransferase family protein [Chitinophagaceae bacterium]